MKILNQNAKLIKQIKNEFSQSAFADRIACLTVHGTALYLDKQNIDSDLDLELVLTEPRPNDLPYLKRILDIFDKKIECQLRYLEEISDATKLISRTKYKIFMYYAYANGLCLLGKDIYRKLTRKVKIQDYRQSLLITTQISYKDVRKSYLAGASAYVVNKHIMRTLAGICLYLGLINYKNIGLEGFIRHEKNAFIDLIKKRFHGQLDKNDLAILDSFTDSYRRQNTNQQIFQLLDKIIILFEQEI